MALTKAQILEGKKTVEAVYIEKLDTELEIRPLTDGQWARVEEVMSSGVKIKSRGKVPLTEIDAGMAAKNDHVSDLLICRMGLIEKWDDKELDSLPAGAVEEISKAIQELSGISKSQEKDAAMGVMVESFRDESGGTGDSDTPPDRPASGADAG